jgi:hypothetical protein
VAHSKYSRESLIALCLIAATTVLYGLAIILNSLVEEKKWKCLGEFNLKVVGAAHVSN